MSPVRVFLTGPPGIGKTTAMRLITRELRVHGRKVGGIITSEIRDSRGRLGFQIEDISTHKVGTLAHIHEKLSDGPSVGKYHVNLFNIETIGAEAITNAVHTADVVIIDEIGPMELKSRGFIVAVESALGSQKGVIGTIHRMSTHPLVNAIRSNPDCHILEVSLHNRDKIPSDVAAGVTR